MGLNMKAYILNGRTPLELLEKEAGGKATNLARLEQCQASVPPWFSLSTGMFHEFKNQFKNIDLWHLPHAEIEELFLSGKIHEELIREIETELLKIRKENCTFAVRSSGIGEDSAQNSFAGQFTSYLHQQSLEQILKSTKLCWASAFTDRARSYRHERKISTQNFGMGVIIQRMVSAEVAGVAFSRNPINPLKTEQMIISSVFGLGEGLVSGELDADHFYITRKKADEKKFQIEPHLVTKDHYFVQSPNGGLMKKEVPQARREVSSLSDQQIEIISDVLVQLEEKLKLPQDIEWVFEEDHFYLVQTRPITNLPPAAYFKNNIKGGRFVLWDNSNITESYNGVTSPLTFSHISRAYRQVYIQFCEVMGVPKELVQEHEPTFRNMLGLIRGRVYYNLGNWYHMIFLFPFSASSNSFMETMMGVKQGLRPELAALFDFTKNPPKYSLPRKLYILWMNLWRIFRVQFIIDEFKNKFDRVYGEAKAKDYTKLSLEELIDAYHHLNKELLYEWKAPIISDTRCMVFFGLLKSLTDKWIKNNRNISLYNDLLSGQGDLPSTEPTRLLMKIARKIDQGDSKIRDWFMATPSKLVLKEMKLKTPEIWKDFERFIDIYGFRCINELKLESTDLHEDPTFAIEAVISFVKMKNTSVDEIISREKENSKRAEETVRANISGPKLIFYNFILKHARRAVKDREDLRLLRTNIFGVCRRIFKALGQRFYQLELLAEPMDIFYITVDEIIAYQEGRSLESSFKELSQLRKKLFDEYRKSPQPPDRFFSEGAAGINFNYPQILAAQDLLATEAPKSNDPKVLIGTPCSPGIVEGVVRVVREASDAEGLSGEIMVSERTDPGWVPLFPSTSGLLIERGSLLSHSAVVARELGIPTIVGVNGGLMKKLKTGMRVRMDASTGEIRILD